MNKMILLLELFCGSSTISKTAKKKGHGTFTVDLRRRKGTCEPDLQADINKLKVEDLKSLIKEQCRTPWDNIELVIWASVPCTVWTYAAGNNHFDDRTPKTDEAVNNIKLVRNTLKLISELSPVYFFIENPQGRLRYEKTLVDWLIKNNGMTKLATWGSYNFPTTKPTNIFTNAHNFTPRPLMPYGRGAKCPGDFNNLTTCQRQAIPQEFANDLIEFLESEKIFRNKTVGTC